MPDESKILYDYDGPFLTTVTRLDQRGNILYSHTYEEFDSRGNPLLENGLFTTSYAYDKTGRRVYQNCPYFEEELVYDPTGNLIQKRDHSYAYDDANQLISEEGSFYLAYDKHYNSIQKDGDKLPIDELNQREDLTYDLNGNLIRGGFVYDAFDQLIYDGMNENSYDALGRRLLSGDTSYFYIEDEEIGSFENVQIKELKVTTTPVAIEIEGKPFAPVVDLQIPLESSLIGKAER